MTTDHPGTPSSGEQQPDGSPPPQPYFPPPMLQQPPQQPPTGPYQWQQNAGQPPGNRRSPTGRGTSS